MRHIVVSKFGNEPDIFGNSFRCGQIGDWEVKKLISALSKDTENHITYYGKAIWDQNKADKCFGQGRVNFIQSNCTNDKRIQEIIPVIDEFHILLGPHAFYNGGANIPSWESIKTSIVTERLLERVAPQIKLMNMHKNAKCYFYMSDRRFLLQAADLMNDNVTLLAQNLKRFGYNRVELFEKDYSNYFMKYQMAEPFRFDTLWLLDKDYNNYLERQKISNIDEVLAISANQVTSDDEIEHSRLSKILEYTDYIEDFIVCGKWTSKKAKDLIFSRTDRLQKLDGLSMVEHERFLQSCQYALVLFNTSDAPQVFIDNYLTPKYWECVYNGCLTFVEATHNKNDFIPEELQVLTGKELSDKLRRCKTDIEYKNKLLALQDSLVKPEYFSGTYFNNYLTELRRQYEATNEAVCDSSGL